MLNLNKAVLLLLIATGLLCTSCKNNQEQEAEATDATAVVAKQDSELVISQEALNKVPIYMFDEFEPLLYKEDEATYVINFWATWCKPCIKEMPYFEQLAQEYKDQNVKVLFVSMDFPRLLEKQVIPFLEKNNIQSPVVLLDDTGANEWIPKVNQQWSGAIPATVIYNSKDRKFFERSFTYQELETELKSVL